MKKILIAILISLFMVVSANAEIVTLAWDPVDTSNGVRIYIGTESGNYTNSHDAGVGVSETNVDNLLPGVTYYFAAKAYSPEGVYSNGYSNEVFYAVPSENVLPELPEIIIGNVTITIQVK